MPGDCIEPTLIRQVQVAIGETSVLVPSAIVSCGWWLSAFYPNADASSVCVANDLDTVPVAGAVLMRNASSSACSLGGLVSVDGVDVPSASAPPSVQVDELAPGDIVAIGDPGQACAAAPRRVVLRDLLVGEFAVGDVTCDLVFTAGLPRPWFGMPDGPLATASTTDVDLEAVRDALDPFGSAA